jgi:glycosyltransferase involved in cell wall biosynthesis
VRIAVIIPAYNVAPFLGEAIASVVHQTYPDWSLTVVDDGSTDDISAVVRRFSDHRIRFIRQSNAGVSVARNAGFRAAGDTADAYLFLDGDDWLAAEALSTLAAALEDSPWAIAAHGRYARVAADGSQHPASPSPEGCLLEQLLTRNLFINGGHLLIRREGLDAAGPFRCDLNYGEDWELWTRLALAGEFAAAACPTPLLFVRERPGSAVFAGGINPRANDPALRAIYANPALIARVGPAKLGVLARRATAETAWAVGRELIRHGHHRDGQRWLGRSLRAAPNLRRVMLAATAWLRCGRFRPYGVGWPSSAGLEAGNTLRR